jgi:hypothetical protein
MASKQRRDPDFDRKMAEVLHVYRDVAVLREEREAGEEPLIACCRTMRSRESRRLETPHRTCRRPPMSIRASGAIRSTDGTELFPCSAASICSPGSCSDVWKRSIAAASSSCGCRTCMPSGWTVLRCAGAEPRLTRGLNRNHDRMLKNVFEGADTAAASTPGPLQDFYRAMVSRGMREELARVTLTRKIAAITLRLKSSSTIIPRVASST